MVTSESDARAAAAKSPERSGSWLDESDSEAKSAPPGFVRSLATGLGLLTRRERIHATALVASILVNSALQTAVLIGVVQAVQSMVGSSSIVSGKLFGFLAPWIGEIDERTKLVVFSVALAVLTLVRTIFGWLQIGWMARFTQKCEVRMSTMVMRQVVNAPYEWHLTRNPERVRETLFGHAVLWSRDFVRGSMQIANDVTFIVFLVAILMWSSPETGAAIAVATTAFGAAIFAVIRPPMSRLTKQKRDALISAHIVCNESIRGIKDVKMAGAEERHVLGFHKYLEVYSGADAKLQVWRQMPRLALESVAYFALIGISCAVIVTGAQGSEIAGIMVMYALAALRVLPMINTIVASSGSLISSFVIVDDLTRLVRASGIASAHASRPPVREPAWNWSRIDVENLAYVYPANNQPALEAVNCAVERGKSYGIVGPSGGGKSTLVDLLAGLIAPTSGSITVGDRRVATAAEREAWRRHFGYVSQRPFLLDASLRDNIVFGHDDGSDDERLLRAVQLACLDRLLARLPQGLDSSVGDQGSNLSGGERQRVAIARALYRGADILVLDEATSALDPLVEREIAESIESLHGRITSIVVSHRLGLVRACDEIWVVDQGRVAASGSHASLMEDSGLYSRMIAANEFSPPHAYP
ncbi:MAG: ABC transporter ATP-binding protein [Telmatospirillum sp.]|nr:ABC transporter ATP-binding protein [Telmatospirillum sp.]